MKPTTTKVPVKTKENKEVNNLEELMKSFSTLNTKFTELERDTKDLRQMYNYHMIRKKAVENAIANIQLGNIDGRQMREVLKKIINLCELTVKDINI
jgi:K+/H+ antiporter YhaU regulatory subunit KhtT